MTPGPRRKPAAETSEYPGLVVHDQRQAGAITIRPSRLSLQAIIYTALHRGWDDVRELWPTIDTYHYDADELSDFLIHLLNSEGEFARLLLVLADVHRRDQNHELSLDHLDHPWWARNSPRERVRAQLQRCLDALREEPEGAITP